MRAQATIQAVLRSKLSEVQLRNPKYSLRSFADRVGVNAGALSAILNGKRNVSRKLAVRIVERLGLDPQERADTLKPFGEVHLEKKSESDADYLRISASQFRVIADWEHFAILSLMRTHDFRSELEWIASRLGISVASTRAAVDRLIQAGMVDLQSDGQLRRSKPKYRTTDDIADLSLRKAHAQTLELARASLERDPISDRDFSSVTMAINPNKIGMAKELIRKFEDDLSNLVESGTQSEVYRLSIQFFPLSQIREKGRNQS